MYKLNTFKVSFVAEKSLGIITKAEETVPILRSIFTTLDADQDHFVILSRSAKNKVTGYKIISSGGKTQCLVDPAIVFRSAIVLGAVNIILAHNHPSGDSEPSVQDKELTKRLKSGGEILNIPILDHIILGCKTEYSFTEQKII